MKSALTLKSLCVASAVSVLALGAQAGPVYSEKQMPEPVIEAESWWSATLSTGVESKYMYRGFDQYAFAGLGVNQSTVTRGSSPLYWTNLEASAFGLTVGFWYGDNFINTGNGFNEIDMYVDYTYSFGPVDLSTGYIGYYFPDLAGPNNSLHEVYFGAAYTGLPYVTPSVTLYQGFGLPGWQGRYVEARLDGSYPIYKEAVFLEPYALVSYSDYLVQGRSNWHHYQIGLNVTWVVNDIISVFGGINYSGPLDVVSGGAKINGNNNNILVGDPGYHNNSDIFGGGGISFTF